MGIVRNNSTCRRRAGRLAGSVALAGLIALRAASASTIYAAGSDGVPLSNDGNDWAIPLSISTQPHDSPGAGASRFKFRNLKIQHGAAAGNDVGQAAASDPADDNQVNQAIIWYSAPQTTENSISIPLEGLTTAVYEPVAVYATDGTNVLLTSAVIDFRAPEPPTMGLFGSGLAALLWVARRRQGRAP